MKIRIIDRWIQARDDLGVEVVGPVVIEIAEDLTVFADILVENFGGPKGTIGVESAGELANRSAEIWRAGYGLSAFGAPSSARYSREATIECLRDWGWSGPRNMKPTWL